MGLVRPSWVEVDLSAIRQNVAAILAAVAPADVCAVVKADGYGHGDVPVAEAALEAGAGRLAVALLSEGIRLREAGIDAPILLLSEPSPRDVGQLVRWELTPTAYHAGFVEALGAAAPGGHPCHVKVDTGMHRVGAGHDEALDLVKAIDAGPVDLEGVWTHLAVAEAGQAYTNQQLSRLDDFVEAVRRADIDPGIVHAANTAGSLGHPGARLDMVRAGIGIYGLRPAAGYAPDVDLRPAMRVLSEVAHVRRHPAGATPSYGRIRALERESTVVTIPIGYADGFSRRLSVSGGRVLINDRHYPLAGTVTMDQIVVDVGDDRVAVGDEVVLLGRQHDAEISADEWAKRLGTINYEVVCGFGPRLPRRYLP